MPYLVQKLFEGAIDIVGDVHGDIAALMQLIRYLGYEDHGIHSKGRRLVFVGDLTDRGPDSVAVVRFVRRLVDNGIAQCVLGNHELNILLNQRKFDNGWFFGEEFRDPETDDIVNQKLADDSIRREMVEFFSSLPLVLQRNDVRVVHACWQPEMVDLSSEAANAIDFHNQHRYNIDLGLAIRSDLKEWQREQRHQNLNPVKVLTSGLEVQAKEPYEDNGKTRILERHSWWEEYQDEEYCFFGHYSQPYGRLRGQTRAICVDYGVARRWVPKEPNDRSPDKWRLAAFRYPEMQVAFDNGEIEGIEI